MLVVGVLGVFVAVVVCGVVFLVGLVRRGLVGLGLVTVARRISSVVGLAVGGVVLRLGVGVRVLTGILIGLVRVSFVLGGLGVGVVGLAVGGVVLRLGVSVRVLGRIMPMLSVGIGLTGATCVAGAVASLAGVGGLIRMGGRRVCRSLSTMRLFVAAAQEFLEGPLLRGNGRCVGGAGCAVGSAASSVGAGGRSASRGSAMRTCAGRGCTGGRSAGCASAMRTCAGCTMRASSVGAGSGSPGRGCTMRASSVGAGGRSASRGSAMRTCACRRSSGCAVGSAASAVGGTAGIRIHERVVVSAVRRAGGSVRGSCVPGGTGIASCGRMRRRGGLSRT